MDTSQQNEEKRREDIAFAEVAFSEKARAIMAARQQDGGGASDSSGRGGGGRAGTNDWDRRLARSNNFLQLCRDDLCGKMKTLKVLIPRDHLGQKRGGERHRGERENEKRKRARKQDMREGGREGGRERDGWREIHSEREKQTRACNTPIAL